MHQAQLWSMHMHSMVARWANMGLVLVKIHMRKRLASSTTTMANYAWTRGHATGVCARRMLLARYWGETTGIMVYVLPMP